MPAIPPHLPVRKNLRAEFHDYSGGIYFITICTRDKQHYFGVIRKGEMHFTQLGQYAHDRFVTLHTHYSYVEVPVFVIMPNHVHAIIRICESPDAPGCIPTVRTALGVVIGGYKQSVTRYARRNSIEFGWQTRFHDHIIRNQHDGNHISDYILNNVARWETDCFNKPTRL
ncbi:MAG: transposase [Paramuribaculum sp.]|nr:transposase [Paramuribaculum sp.]